MRTLAIIGMLFGWLFYSTMAAWAGCPTCPGMDQAISVETGSAHHHMQGMDMPDTAGKADPAKSPCTTSGMAHTPFCAACLILPPVVAIDTAGKPAFGHPLPALSRTLRDNRPAPQAPPPRLV